MLSRSPSNLSRSHVLKSSAAFVLMLLALLVAPAPRCFGQGQDLDAGSTTASGKGTSVSRTGAPSASPADEANQPTGAPSTDASGQSAANPVSQSLLELYVWIVAYWAHLALSLLVMYAVAVLLTFVFGVAFHMRPLSAPAWALFWAFVLWIPSIAWYTLIAPGPPSHPWPFWLILSFFCFVVLVCLFSSAQKRREAA